MLRFYLLNVPSISKGLRLDLVLERQPDLGPKLHYLALDKLCVHLHHFGDPHVCQLPFCVVYGIANSLFPVFA